jgi:hypothetical protein
LPDYGLDNSHDGLVLHWLLNDRGRGTGLRLVDRLRLVDGLRLVNGRRVDGLSRIRLSRRLALHLGLGLGLRRRRCSRSRDRVLHGASGLLELAETLADCAADLGKLAGADDYQGDDQDDQQVRG